MSGFKKTAVASSLGVLPKEEDKKETKPVNIDVKAEQDKK